MMKMSIICKNIVKTLTNKANGYTYINVSDIKAVKHENNFYIMIGI